MAAGLTTAASYFAQQNVYHKAEAVFDQSSNDIARDITERLSTYVQVLVQTRGFVEASGPVTREEFATYIKSIDINKSYPGVQGVGIALLVPAAQIDAHIREIRSHGFPEYSVRPPNPRAFYYPITMIEPFNWRNQRAFGYDMMTEETRRKSMEQARDSGLPQLSGKVRLVQETDEAPQPGFLLYVPKYQSGSDTSTIEGRRRYLESFIYSPFRSIDLMQGIFGRIYRHDQVVSFEIYDGEAPTSDGALYIRSTNGPQFNKPGHRPHFSKLKQVEVYGRHWTLYTLSLIHI